MEGTGVTPGKVRGEVAVGGAYGMVDTPSGELNGASSVWSVLTPRGVVIFVVSGFRGVL